MGTTSLGALTVGPLCLGTMLMGAKTPAEEAHRMLDRFLDTGQNFLDRIGEVTALRRAPAAG